MKISLELSELQRKFIEDHPDFNLQEWFHNSLNKKIKVKADKINVIIAAAGYDTRISQIDADIPKAMLKVKGKSLLERQIEMFNSMNINDISVIRGFKKEQINLPDINYYDNNDYETTGILYSFFLASEKMTEKTLLSYADVFFERDIAEKLIYESSDYAIVVDMSWHDNYHSRLEHTISEAELVEVKDDFVTAIGNNIPIESAYGEFIGLASFSQRGAVKAKELYKKTQEIKGKKIKEASLSDFLCALIEDGEKIVPIGIHGGWFEIDTFEDFRKAWVRVP
ncbi:NTP transferase domain-containing protein [Spirochaetota bacterium]